MKRDNQCDFQIIVDPLPDPLTPATSVSVLNDSTCAGTSKTLTPVGGSSGETGTWYWFADSVCTTFLDSGNTYIVTPGVNTTYWVRAENKCDTTSVTKATVIVQPATAITSNPANETICQGQSTTFSIALQAAFGLSYQWEYSSDGGQSYTSILAAGSNPDYAGYNTSQLTVNNCPAAINNYLYLCVVTNSCSSASSDSAVLTISTGGTAIAGTPVNTCAGSGAVNVTSGSSAANYSSIAWTSSGTGSFSNANSLTTATYTPSAADITAGSVTLTLTATGSGGCGNGTDTKTLTIASAPTAVAGAAVSTCSGSGAVSITSGSSASNYTGVLWTSSGTGTFANANSLTTATYTPSGADITAGSVILTLTASGNSGCGNATDTKTMTIAAESTAVAGTAIGTCAGSGSSEYYCRIECIQLQQRALDIKWYGNIC